MKKLLLLATAFLSIQTIKAQISFEEAPKPIPFEEVISGSIAFSDIDGDGDQDVLITGLYSGKRISKLYQNDGTGTFTEVLDTPFDYDGVGYSSIAFADVDGDNDLDVLITGVGHTRRISKLYTNDGTGTFIEVLDTPFEEVGYSSIAFTDIDGDDDQDVLITGVDKDFTSITKLYQNDGTGVFTEVLDTPFADAGHSSIAFADIDGDNDQDLLITGQDNNGISISKLYNNDGSGTYTEVPNTPFEGVSLSSIAFNDIDDDGDQDVLITGKNNAFTPISKLYTNDGEGIFTEVSNTPFEGVGYGAIAFADVDGDNDQDLLITGEGNSFTPTSKLYQNDGKGTFTEVLDTPFEQVRYSSIAFADANGDNNQDILMMGASGSEAISKLYINTSIAIGIGENLYASYATVYPNPAKNWLYIELNKGVNATVIITNTLGQIVFQENVKNSNLTIDISALKSGVYMVTITEGSNQTTIQRLVKM